MAMGLHADVWLHHTTGYTSHGAARLGGCMEERRRFPRRPLREDSASVPVMQQVRIMDISTDGVLISSMRPVEVGTRACLRLSLGGSPFTAEIQVQRVTSIAGGASGYSLGAQFVAISADHRQLIQQFIGQ